MRDEHPGKAPNYTDACIFMFGINVTWILMVILVVWGLPAVILTALVLDKLITFLHVRATARAAEDRANPRAKIRR